jgi:hypothetical protein
VRTTRRVVAAVLVIAASLVVSGPSSATTMAHADPSGDSRNCQSDLVHAEVGYTTQAVGFLTRTACPYHPTMSDTTVTWRLTDYDAPERQFTVTVASGFRADVRVVRVSDNVRTCQSMIRWADDGSVAALIDPVCIDSMRAFTAWAHIETNEGYPDEDEAPDEEELLVARSDDITTPLTTPLPSPSGYWMVSSGSEVFAFGDAPRLHRSRHPASPAVDIEPSRSGRGFTVLHADGQQQSYPAGGARAVLVPGETATSISMTMTGSGSWVFTSTGGVVAQGDAVHYGGMSGTKLNGPVLDSVATPSGRGYYMVASDGGVFTFGDAVFRGSIGDVKLNAPVQSLVPDPDGTGYWLVASDGGIFAFDAEFYGSMGATRLNKPVTGMVGYPRGYLMVAEDGGVFSFGDARFHGSLGDHPPAQPIVAVAALT